MRLKLKSALLALLIGSTAPAFADDVAMIGAECAQSNACATQALREFYAKVAPMEITKSLTLTDFSVKTDIAVASVLMTNTRAELDMNRNEQSDLSDTLDAYARGITCGVPNSIEQIYMKNGGQIIWKYYYSDGEYLSSLAFSSCI